MEKELLEKDIPWGYPLCFHGDCANKDKCLHYLAQLLTSKERNYGNAIYPTAWQNGECKCYNEKNLSKRLGDLRDFIKTFQDILWLRQEEEFALILVAE